MSSSPSIVVVPSPDGFRRRTSRARPACESWIQLELDARSETGRGRALAAARVEIARCESIRDENRPDNDVVRLRAAKPGDTLVLDPRTGVVLRLALALARGSAGRFDLRRGGGTPGAPTLAHAYRLLTGRRLRVLAPLDLEPGDLAAAHALDRVHAVLGRCGAPDYAVRAGDVVRVRGRTERLFLHSPDTGAIRADLGELRSGAAAIGGVKKGGPAPVLVFAARALDAAALARIAVLAPDAPETLALLARRRARAAVVAGPGRARWLTEPPPPEVFAPA